MRKLWAMGLGLTLLVGLTAVWARSQAKPEGDEPARAHQDRAEAGPRT